MTGCTKSTTAGATVTNFAQGMAYVSKAVAKNSPHIVNSSVVASYRPSFRLRNILDFLLPQASAGSSSLSSAWGVASTLPGAGQVLLANNFFGGASTGVTDGGSTFTCTSAAAYCPTPGTYNTSESLIDYVGQDFDPQFENTNGASVTPFGRLTTSLGIPCAIGNLATTFDTDGLPPVGTFTLTFPTSTSSVVYQPLSSGGCGFSSAQMAGQTITTTISAVSPATNYTKTFSFSSQTHITVYLKLDTTNGVMNVMSVENQVPAGRYAADRAILNVAGLNTSGPTLAFEYVSTGSNCTTLTDGCGSATSGFSSGEWNTSFELHRMFIDQGNDAAYLLTAKGSPGNSSGAIVAGQMQNMTTFTAAGKPAEIAACSATSCSQDLAFSAGFVGQTDGTSALIGEAANTINVTDFNGCVNVATRAVDPDDTLTAAACGVAGTGASTAATAVDAVRLNFATDVEADLVATTSGSTTLAFTNGTNMYTAHY